MQLSHILKLGGVGFDDGLLAIDHVKIQSYAVLITIIWTVIVTYIILKVISLFTSLRVDEENEIEGLDTLLTEKVVIITKCFDY